MQQTKLKEGKSTHRYHAGSEQRNVGNDSAKLLLALDYLVCPEVFKTCVYVKVSKVRPRIDQATATHQLHRWPRVGNMTIEHKITSIDALV